jgi:hypothetical protein
MGKDKDGDKKERHPHTQGTVIAEDEDLALWLNQLWARKEFPERIELFQAFGRNKLDLGECIHHHDLKEPNVKLDIEQVAKLTNEFLSVAQNDCDVVQRKSWYLLRVIDYNRKAAPLVRRLGPLDPKRSYAIAKVGQGGDEEDADDEIMDPRSLAFRYNKENTEQNRWDKRRNDTIIGEMILLQDNIIKDLRQHNQLLMTQNMGMFQQMQESEDRKVQRDILLEEKKFSLYLKKEGLRTARNLLPSLFGPAEQPQPQQQMNGHGPTLVEGNGTNGATDHGPSRERTLVGNFLHDIDEEEELHIKLFGDFKEGEGNKLVQIAPGIFHLKQYSILLGVAGGRLAPSALDQLLPLGPDETIEQRPLAITKEQIAKAMNVGVTDGIGSALFEVVGLRKEAQAAAAQPPQATN